MPSLPSFSENVLSMTRGDVLNEDRTKIKNGLLCLGGRCELEGSVPWGRDSGSGPRNIVAEVVPPVSLYAPKGSGEHLGSGASWSKTELKIS